MPAAIERRRYRVTLWPGSSDLPDGVFDELSDEVLAKTSTSWVVEDVDDVFTTLTGLCQEHLSVCGSMERIDDATSQEA